jgi:hypothetical protein
MASLTYSAMFVVHKDSLAQLIALESCVYLLLFVLELDFPEIQC